MNYRKIIILPALLILSHVLYISCCKCVDSNKYFYKLSGASTRIFGNNNIVIDTGIVTNIDTVFLQYDFNFNCVASAKNPLAFLVNESYACKCPECGTGGPKSKIASIMITSDSIYNGIPANTSLNDLFNSVGQITPISIDSLKNSANYIPGYRLYGARLFTTVKPANDKGHSLTMRMIFEDGTEIVASANRIRWI